jgi:hypothetical protein
MHEEHGEKRKIDMLSPPYEGKTDISRPFLSPQEKNGYSFLVSTDK